jgi:hypothetical protein
MTANRSFGNVAPLKYEYLRMTVTKPNLIEEAIKTRFNAGNACYHSREQNLVSDIKEGT